MKKAVQKRVSIIIPFYNVEGCIMRCLASVGRQTFGDIEVLLIDDCSTDNSTSIVNDFIEKYDGPIVFTVLSQEVNGGQSAARNRGMREAQGEYLYFLDSDDYISDDCIELLMEEMDRNRELQMVIGNYIIVGPLFLAPFSLEHRVHFSDEIIEEQLRYDIYTMPWNKLIRKDFLLQNGLFFQPGIVHEDNLWSFCSAFCFDQIGVVLKPTYYYIIREGSTERSHTRSWHQQQLFEVHKHLIRFIFESTAPSKKNVSKLTTVFRFVEREMIPFVMEPVVQGDEDLAFARYQELRSLPYWTWEDVTNLPGITPSELKSFKHFSLPIKAGFKLYRKQHKKYKIPKEMNTMKVSIITVNYNNLSGLRRTLPSILSQTYTGYELIVIDGSSKDGSKEYLESLERIDDWVSEPDSGVYHAMNKGVQRAHGEFCIFMNSGDTFFSALTLESVIPLLGNADFYSGCSTFVDNHTTYTCFPPEKMSMDFLLQNSLNHQSTFIKTAFLRTHPYDESFRIMSDWGLLAENWIKGECTYESLPEMIAIYYLDGISSTNKKSADIERGIILKHLAEIAKGREREDILKTLKWNEQILNEYHQIVAETNNGAQAKRQQKLMEKIDKAMVLPPLQRDLKIIRNTFKAFLKDLFS